jgi:hypothetical protein
MLVVAQHLQAGGVGADLEQATSASALRWQGATTRGPWPARRMGLDVQHHRLQAGGFGQALPVLHAVLARRGDQHLDIASRRGAGADDAEVEADLVQRERDVLVGLGLDLQFHSSSRRPAGSMIFLVITADCGMAITTCLVLVPLLATTLRTAAATSSNFSIWPSVIQPFSKGSDANAPARIRPSHLAQFHQLHAGRTDVQPDHRRVLAAQQQVQKLTEASPIAKMDGRRRRRPRVELNKLLQC